MPMHPRVEDYDLFLAMELPFVDVRDELMEKLILKGFIDEHTRPIWESELAKPQYRSNIGDLVAATKLMIDPKASADGKLSSKEPLSILAHLAPLLDAARRLGHDYSLPAIAKRTIMDYGSGIYGPLSASVVLFANGFGKAISYEPFELRIDFVVAGLFELIKSIFEHPARFRLPGIGTPSLKENLARLEFENLPDRLGQLNRREIAALDLGGVILTNRPDTIADASVDTIFSNSVLEHVEDLVSELAWHRRILTERGLCFHTVDFVDHRYYFDKSLNILEMYYDGILDEINGLRPAQMEAMFLANGFGCGKLQKLAVPESLIDRSRPIKAPFSELTRDSIFEWCNGYILQKN